MYTLSITEALKKMQETISGFEGVTAYKVEFGMWDHSTRPFIQLYVNCKINGESQFKHALADTFYEAMQEIKQWYQGLSRQELVVETEDLLV